MKDTFDARKRNLGAEPERVINRWRSRLIKTGIALGVVLVVTAVAVVWWSMTHVTMVRANVCAAMVSLATDVDARMAELHVKTGSRVQKGDVLARLDDSALRASLASAEADQAVKASLHAQAKAGREFVSKSVEAEIELAQARVDIAKGQLESVEAQVDQRRARLPVEIRSAEARRDEAAARLAHLRKGTREETVEAAKARLNTSRALADLAGYQVKQTEALVERHVESSLELELKKTDLVAKQNQALEAELQLKQHLSGPTDEQVQVVVEVLEAREAELALARMAEKDITVLAADLHIRQAELRQAEAELKKARAQLAQVALAEEKVKTCAAEMLKTDAEVARSLAMLQSMVIVSPVSGTVIRTFDHPGEVCRKGIPTILVADDSAGRWVEGYVAEDDAMRLRPGQSARIKILVGSGVSARGTIESVGLMTSDVDRGQGGGASSGQSAQMVWARIRTNEPLEDVLPGMKARVVVATRKVEALRTGAASAEARQVTNK